MPRISGRKGRIYMDITGAAAATPLPFFAKWSISHSTDRFEVTAMGDDNKIYLTGLPDATGSFSGFYDDATAQTYTAAVDGLPRKFYLYPSILTNAQYWFGTILVDLTVDSDVNSAITVSASWNAATTVAKIG